MYGNAYFSLVHLKIQWDLVNNDGMIYDEDNHKNIALDEIK